MELINGYYVGNVSEDGSSAVAVPQARFESEQNAERQSPAFWYEQWQDISMNYHPLGGIVYGSRQTLIDATKGSVSLVNLTPHDIVLIKDGEVAHFSPSGLVARVAESSVPDGMIGEFPVVRKQYGAVEVLSRSDFLTKVPGSKVEPMPEPQEGLMYIVPMLVGQVLAGSRQDIIGPDFGIGGAARDKSGQITGARGFIRF